MKQRHNNQKIRIIFVLPLIIKNIPPSRNETKRSTHLNYFDKLVINMKAVELLLLCFHQNKSAIKIWTYEKGQGV